MWIGCAARRPDARKPRNQIKCCTMSVLLKTEPSEYSFAELERDGETVWDGITNPQALRFLAS